MENDNFCDHFKELFDIDKNILKLFNSAILEQNELKVPNIQEFVTKKFCTKHDDDETNPACFMCNLGSTMIQLITSYATLIFHSEKYANIIGKYITTQKFKNAMINFRKPFLNLVKIIIQRMTFLDFIFRKLIRFLYVDYEKIGSELYNVTETYIWERLSLNAELKTRYFGELIVNEILTVCFMHTAYRIVILPNKQVGFVYRNIRVPKSNRNIFYHTYFLLDTYFIYEMLRNDININSKSEYENHPMIKIMRDLVVTQYGNTNQQSQEGI